MNCNTVLYLLIFICCLRSTKSFLSIHFVLRSCWLTVVSFKCYCIFLIVFIFNCSFIFFSCLFVCLFVVFSVFCAVLHCSVVLPLWETGRKRDVPSAGVHTTWINNFHHPIIFCVCVNQTHVESTLKKVSHIKLQYCGENSWSQLTFHNNFLLFYWFVKGPVTDWWPIQAIQCISLEVSCNKLALPTILNGINRGKNWVH